MTDAATARAHEAAEQVARAAYGRLVAYLAGRTGDLAAAEDALSDALVAALRRWPVDGVPERPDAWLVTVARRRQISDARREAVAWRSAPDLAVADELRSMTGWVGPLEDDRLRLLFVCAHPAIDPAMHAPLMLQTVLGLDAERIGSAFLVAPSTMGQRLVRTKAKIRTARIPFVIPEREALVDRLGAVLEAIYAAYGSGWDDVAGSDPRRGGVTDEAIRLARLVVELLPDEPEAHGLLSLMLWCESRRAARRDDDRFVPLSDQDPARWSLPLIEEAAGVLARASTMGRVGRFQLEAAIQAVHAARAVTGRTDWASIVTLYDGLVTMAPTIGAHVSRAAAVLEARGPDVALAALDGLAQASPSGIDTYQPYWTVRAAAYRGLRMAVDASVALERAIGLSGDPAIRAFLLAQHADPAGARRPS